MSAGRMPGRAETPRVCGVYCKTGVVRRLRLDRGQPVRSGRAEADLARHGKFFRDYVVPQGLDHPFPVVQERVESLPEDGADPSPCDELLEQVGDQHEADIGLGRDRVSAVHVFQSEAAVLEHVESFVLAAGDWGQANSGQLSGCQDRCGYQFVKMARQGMSSASDVSPPSTTAGLSDDFSFPARS